MNLDWNTVWLGIIEGITEFLPISSTGHLLIAEHWFGEKSDLFNIFIQSGAVLAVLLIYWERLVNLVTRWSEPENLDYLMKLGVAFGLTAVGGVMMGKFGFKLPHTLGPIAWAVLVGAGVIFFAEWRLKGVTEEAKLTWSVAAWVGVAQLVAAVFPGTSRSAASILAAMLLGVSRSRSTEFSFLVGIPTLLAAGAYSLWKERHSLEQMPRQEWFDLGIGFIVSMIVAFVAVKWLLRYVQSHTFLVFAWYRLALGIGLVAWLLISA